MKSASHKALNDIYFLLSFLFGLMDKWKKGKKTDLIKNE